MSLRKPIRQIDVDSKERILEHLIQDYLQGALDDYVVLMRAHVVEVDSVGAQLQTDPVKNPPNSIRARIISRGIDKDITNNEDLDVFWPLFPHDAMPIKASEHVYVLFEDMQKMDHGLWLARIPEPYDVYDQNLIPGTKKYEVNSANNSSAVGINQAVQDTVLPPEPDVPAKDFVVETVPRFAHRVGDRVIEGSNNTIIVLGRDRPNSSDSGEKKQAGTIDIVAGRAKQTDMDMSEDKSRIYVSSKTDIDGNLKIGFGSSSGTVASIGLKSDQVRIVGRKGVKIAVEGGDFFASIQGKSDIEATSNVNVKSGTKVVVDAPFINIGSANSAEPFILGTSFVATVLTPLLVALTADSAASIAFGIPGVVQLPALTAALPAIQSAIAATLSKKNMTE